MEQIDYDIIKKCQTKFKSESVPMIPKDCAVLYSGPLGTLLVPQTVTAASIVTSRSVWCTANPEDSPTHIMNNFTSNYYVFIDTKGNLYSWNVEMTTGRGRFVIQNSNKYWGLEKQTIRELEPIKFVFDLIETEILKDPKKTYNYVLSVIQGRWPVGERVIAKDDTYFNKYIRFINKKGEQHPYVLNHMDNFFVSSWLRVKWWQLKAKLKRVL
mgnify:CR=1 FL=1